MSEVIFTASDGQTYEISVDDFGEEIRVVLGGKTVGTISLRYIEGDPPRQPDTYHITHLALEECAHRGIGRRCLELHREVFSSPITAGADNGTTSDDGSHLTGDGPGFIAKMSKAGIVVPITSHDDYYDRYDE
ncbi:hypothetical protein [Acidovorax sp. FJL06]|uniref:hypothetical protein n=1 Tax=Acidovorax sp. FJL06 TaxID=2153365 RepID=UPI000F572FF7|nr:hypothetical protein [Acidovorax sp. FJL06]